MISKQTEQTVLFRADASVTLGAGHLVRCLALADGLYARGVSCGFAVNATTLRTLPALSDSPHSIIELQDTDKPTAFLDDNHQQASWLVVDHYELGASFESACRSKIENILVVDDLANRAHDCDVLLDPTLGRSPADYQNYVPDSCHLLLGPGYAPLRPQFAAARQQSLSPRTGQCRRILVSFGATDPQGYTLTALKAIQQTHLDIGVDVMIGASSPHIEAVRQLADALPMPVKVHQQVDNVADLMANADLAIGAAGSTAWERCCLGLPAIVIVAADNQQLIAIALQTAGAAIILSMHDQSETGQLATILNELCVDERQLAAMSKAAADVCDGRGVERICDILLQ